MHSLESICTDPLELFCAYSHKDAASLERFKSHVAVLRRKNWIQVWTDQDIRAGDRWDEEITRHLESAAIIVLLVSADFLASEYCYSREMAAALGRARGNSCVVVPIIARACDW